MLGTVVELGGPADTLTQLLGAVECAERAEAPFPSSLHSVKSDSQLPS